MELVVALDRATLSENLALVRELKEFNNLWLKVGFRSYIRDGKEILKEIKNINPTFKIFLDLKLYDIPNTMADAGDVIADLGVDMFNLHSSSGLEGMRTVMERLKNRKNRPIVLAVTALTSFNESGFKSVYGTSIEEKARQFAIDTHRAGVDGVVSSLHESKAIKEVTSSEFLTLTPGIRPFGESSDDQKRVGTVEDAHRELVDYIVVGRPIYKSDNPVDVVKRILERLR